MPFHTQSLIRLCRAVIKRVGSEDEIARLNLNRERQTYQLPDVASAECFRRIYDVIDTNTIALEWLDTTLAGLSYQPNASTYAILKKVLWAALTSCDILDGQGYVNTGNQLNLW